MFVYLQKSCGNSRTNMMVLGGGNLGRWLDHEGRAFINEIHAFIKEA